MGTFVPIINNENQAQRKLNNLLSALAHIHPLCSLWLNLIFEGGKNGNANTVGR